MISGYLLPYNHIIFNIDYFVKSALIFIHITLIGMIYFWSKQKNIKFYYHFGNCIFIILTVGAYYLVLAHVVFEWFLCYLIENLCNRVFKDIR